MRTIFYLSLVLSVGAAPTAAGANDSAALARHLQDVGSVDRGLGVYRWVVERTLSWLHQCRRLRIRFERFPEIHEAFLSLGCIMICWQFLTRRRRQKSPVGIEQHKGRNLFAL